jgi:hypothetical protein
VPFWCTAIFRQHDLHFRVRDGSSLHTWVDSWAVYSRSLQGVDPMISSLLIMTRRCSRCLPCELALE